MLQNRFKLRLWDPVLNKGAIWTYWEGAYRDTGRDEGATMVLQTPATTGLVLVHPAARRHRVSVGVVAPFDYLFKGRSGSHEQTYHEEVERRPAVKAAHRRREARHRLLRDPRLLVSLDRGRRRRLGAGRRRVRLPRSALFVGRAAGAEVRRAGRRRDRRRARTRRHQRGAAGRVGRRTSTRASIACAGWSASSTTASASAAFVRNYPELRGTVTDLLIGDLFTDRVDKVWGPMESLYRAGKKTIPTWRAGTTRRRRPRQGQRAGAAGRAAAVADGRRRSGTRVGCSSPRPTSPASSISRGCSATWKRRSTRRGAPPAFRLPERGGALGWPRVAASFEFRNPLHFEDEIEVHGPARGRRLAQSSVRAHHRARRRADRQRPDHDGLRAEATRRPDARHGDPRRDRTQAARGACRPRDKGQERCIFSLCHLPKKRPLIFERPFLRFPTPERSTGRSLRTRSCRARSRPIGASGRSR